MTSHTDFFWDSPRGIHIGKWIMAYNNDLLTLVIMCENEKILSANFRENSIFRFWPWRSRLDLSWHWKSGSSKMGKILIFSCSFEMHQWLHSGNERISFVGFGASESKRYFKNDSRIGCKPFQEKNLEIGILCTSDSMFAWFTP